MLNSVADMESKNWAMIAGKQSLTDGRISACLTEDAARELTLDSFSSMADLLQEAP